MRFQCPFCSYHMRGITPSMFGRKVRCPDCEKTNHIGKDPFESGRILGDFIIKRRLGVGSIGAVYFASQISLDRSVALKILSKEYSNSKGIDSFLKEARAAAKLSHPNLIQSFGVGEEEGVCFMAMNFIEGETVKDKIRREGKVEVDEALHIVQQVAEGLFFAWVESGLIHRDVKPENIMLTKESAVKLADLGLAINESEWHEDMEISGSPSYMSPEQFTGEKIDTRSDIYSLGITLYQLLAGKLPFDGATLKTVARQHFYDPPKPLHKLNPMIPTKVSLLVQKMVEKEPDKRFQNMEEVIEEIWKVRQSTAPDKDLVPSVHTISLKRLDYDLQKLTQERNKHITVEKAKDKKKTIILLRIFMVSIPIILVILLFLWLVQGQKSKQQLQAAAMVKALGRLIDDKIRTPSDLKIEWDNVEVRLNPPQSDFDRELQTRMLFYRELIKNRRLMERKNELQKVTELTKETASQKLQQLIEKNQKAAALLFQKEEELKNKEAKFNTEISKTKRSKNQIGKKSKIQTSKLNERYNKLTAKYNKLWQDNMRVKVYALAARGKVNEAIVIINSVAMKRPGNDKWFDYYLSILDNMQKFGSAVMSSGSKYAGIEIEEGEIKNIIGGIVTLSNDEDDKGIPLTSLSMSSVTPIVQTVFPEMEETDLQKMLILLTDGISSITTTTKNDELEKLCDAICEYKIDRIRTLSLIDEKKAKEEARNFLKKFAEVPNLNEKYKPELKNLFSKE
jgi:serine/threonine protein kinase